MNAKIFDIQRFSIHDGPGIRTTVFFKGCNLRCKWCHNPESQSGDTQIMYYAEKCTHCGHCTQICTKLHTAECTACGRCVQVCNSGAREQCGYSIDAENLFNEIIKDKKFYETSGGGVTLSGGEPLLQADFAAHILRMCKEDGIHTAIETAANVPGSSFEKVLPYTDLVLCDIKAIDEQKHIEGTGASNKQILQNIHMLKDSGCEVLFRMPVIPGFNDSEIAAAAELVQPYELELLKYHNICSGKYAALNMSFGTSDVKPMTDEQMKQIAAKYDNVIYNETGI